MWLFNAITSLIYCGFPRPSLAVSVTTMLRTFLIESFTDTLSSKGVPTLFSIVFPCALSFYKAYTTSSKALSYHAFGEKSPLFMYLRVFTAGASCSSHTQTSLSISLALWLPVMQSHLCLYASYRGLSVETLLLLQQHKHRPDESGCVRGMFELRVSLSVCLHPLPEYHPYVSFSPADLLSHLFDKAKFGLWCHQKGRLRRWGRKPTCCVYEVVHHNVLLMYVENTTSFQCGFPSAAQDLDTI